MNTKLIWITPDAEKLIGYIARVSNPKNQDNPNVEKLLTYCIDHKHWSPFEMASACIEIETSRAISAQILRHRSFSFQEFSQRYADTTQLGFESIEIRKQSDKNRQSSTDIFDPQVGLYAGESSDTNRASQFIAAHLEMSEYLYKELLKSGVAKETARMILPMTTATRLYMSGTIRSWIHYINLRAQPDTQKEHREIAQSIKAIFCKELPTISTVLGWQEL